MAFRVSSEGYSVLFKDQDQVHEYVSEDVDDGYTCPFCNTSYEKDLQLAAELGKTLLERNKELESALRQQHNLVDDQAQEIEYLRKQTAALREVNDSRMRIYEQLEISIQELEHTNHRLTTQSAADKKHISNLENQLEKLEMRLEECQKRLDEAQAEGGKRVPEEKRNRHNSEELTSLKEEVVTLKAGCTKHQASLRALQATVDTVTQENLRLEEEVLSLQHKQEELTLLEQIGRGKVCSRCLRSQEEISLTGDEDSLSIVESIMSNDHCQSILRENLEELLSGSENPYKGLIEKYELLVNLQREAASRVPSWVDSNHHCIGEAENKGMSLQDELKMSGEFSSFTREIEEDIESEAEPPVKPTPDFSETETSSGFSDETINKGTQTDEGGVPGSFLCSITDGDDCKFSIYDEANQIDSRFRKTPEYRKLFREIFDVLKRAAEAKDEGEMLPLLEDMTPIVEQPPQVPPVTPAREEVTELAFATETTEGVHVSQVSASQDVQKIHVQEKRDILESLSAGLGGKKKKSRRHRGSDSQASPQPGSSCSRKKRWHASDSGRSTPTERPKPLPPPVARPPSEKPPPPRYPDFAPPCSASHEVAKLKQIEKSYAEVLRMGRQRINRN